MQLRMSEKRLKTGTMAVKTRLHAFGRSCQLVIDDRSGNGNALAELGRQELNRLEEKFSSYRDSSLISRINQAAGTGAFTPLDAESRSLFEYVSALWSQSNHLFDPTTRLLQNCYAEDGRQIASASQLQNILKLVGWRHLELNDQGAHLAHKGMLIDLNSCICAYAADSVRKILVRNGAESAMIELDRDVATIGRQPDGANWLVGVKHPRGSRTAITRLKVNSQGFAMRGDFERRIDVQGENFGRGLSPVDGQPVPGMLSVIVVADNCLTACSAASIARLKTEQAAINWLKELGMPWMTIDRELACHGPLAPSARA